jgi:NitT/TauT family transport system permease protein
LIVEPWIQFFRTIPPIALIPLVIVIFGIGTSAKIAIIFFAVFLVMVVTIYQGVRNVDPTLIKAARVLDATAKDIFLDVIVPASFPYILVGIRLGLATALTTLVAAELTGASQGLGNMIQEAALYFNMGEVILGIITIGVIGFMIDKAVLFLEKKLTGWQEVNNR